LASHRLATVVGSHLDKVVVHLLPLFHKRFSAAELGVLARRLAAARRVRDRLMGAAAC